MLLSDTLQRPCTYRFNDCQENDLSSKHSECLVISFVIACRRLSLMERIHKCLVLKDHILVGKWMTVLWWLASLDSADRRLNGIFGPMLPSPVA